jgi:prevent-host-death family protein
MNSYSSDDARRSFRHLLDDVMRGEHLAITRYGDKVAMLVPADFYEDAVAASRSVLADEIERVVGGYPGNEEERPKLGVGEFLNDAQWAAKIIREWKG